jgi:F-type H+-transporting ATPase subunit delta
MGGARFSRPVTPRFSNGGNSFFWSFERVETSGGIRASLAGRYASALFDLARDERQIESISGSLDKVKAALAGSADLKALTTSPLVNRDDAAKAIAATSETLGLDPLTRRFLGVLAKNGRLSQLDAVIRMFARLAAQHRGETTAEVTSAFPLNDGQVAALKANLKARGGSDVTIEAKVDPSILGGIVVRLGSQMIDASIKTKLNTLALAMKG